MFKRKCTPYCAALTAVQVADLRNSYFEKRKAKYDPNFENYSFFDIPNKTQIEIRRTIIVKYLESRPDWYQRLERNTQTFNFNTEEFIKDLLICRFNVNWKTEKKSLRRARLSQRKHSKSLCLFPPTVKVYLSY